MSYDDFYETFLSTKRPFTVFSKQDPCAIQGSVIFVQKKSESSYKYVPFYYSNNDLTDVAETWDQVIEEFAKY